MSKPRPASRVTVLSAAFVLAFGASGVAASAAFADTAPSATSTATIAPSASPDAAPTFTLTSPSAGVYSLNITIPGTSIAVGYTVDPSGAVTSATTSTAGATVAVDGHDLTVSLADGRVVSVELGDAGNTVKEVSVSKPEADENNDDQGENNDNQGENSDAAEPDSSASEHSGEHSSEHSSEHSAATDEPTAKPSSDQSAHHESTGDSKSSDSEHSGGGSGGSGGSGESGGSD